METINPHQFCASEHDPRTWLHTPFTLNGKTVASDGRIMIELDVAGDYPQCPAEEVAKTEHALSHSPAAGYQPLTMQEKPKFVTCRRCSGKGHGRACPSCGGEGEFEHHNHYYECTPCAGSGEIGGICHYCRGTGKKEITDARQIDGAHFPLRYLSLIANLPGAEFASAGPKGVACFKFHGGRGVLMPNPA